MGEERLALILEAAGRPVPETRPEVFLVSADEDGRREVLRRAAELRRAGIACDLDARGGKLARQFKQAERVGARHALVLGASEIASGQAKLKDMATREEVPVALAALAARVRGLLVVEMSAGQMVEDVRLAVEGRVPVAFTGRTGGMVPTPGDVVEALRRLQAATAPGRSGSRVGVRP
jgi:hypothetical protein